MSGDSAVRSTSSASRPARHHHPSPALGDARGYRLADGGDRVGLAERPGISPRKWPSVGWASAPRTMSVSIHEK